ncbi:MAG: branched-chain amino acid aminotransferase [Streptosporangiales bacterium]|nr:branched-chain amino acid aminotransferase [Streptosporangiales bacterium]
MSLEFSVRPAERVPDRERARLVKDPPFGQVFTDHMITIRWDAERGWHDARLEPYGPLPLAPSAQVFHYGQAIFEGLKAYRRPDGSVVAFRPDANARRLNRSAARIAMPALPEEDFLAALELLVGTDRDWVPEHPGHSLYVRPFMVATEPSLGVYRPSGRYLFVIIAAPAGSYFKGGVKPVSAWLSTEYVRAAPGGTGEAKFGGNYAGTFLAQRQAAEQGCDQVVWLDAGERRWVDEMGTCNLFFVYGSRLVTPALTGTLLPGVTRDSVITLARDLGYPVEEGRVSVPDWRADAASGALTEVFSCATSSLLTPVDRVKGRDVEWTIGDGSPGPVTTRLREELTGIQLGERPDPYGWVHKIT